jgi:hypothetical protein
MPTPILIGVADHINRSKLPSHAIEPLHLMLAAIESALKDTNIPFSSTQKQTLLAAVDSLDVVRTWTWPYPDLPGLIASKLGISPRRKYYTGDGGNQPGVVFDEAARRIARGEVRVAVLSGGEALGSREFLRSIATTIA